MGAGAGPDIFVSFETFLIASARSPATLEAKLSFLALTVSFTRFVKGGKASSFRATISFS